MKRFVIGLGLALLPAIALAAPDFSGTWVRDNTRSDGMNYPVYWLVRSAPIGLGANQQPVMEVHQSAATLQVADSVHPVRTYALDGQPHVASTDTMLQKVSVSASVQGEALVLAISEPYGGMPGNVAASVKDTWSLSPDGKTLTITTVRETPAARQSSKQVYSRR